MTSVRRITISPLSPALLARASALVLASGARMCYALPPLPCWGWPALSPFTLRRSFLFRHDRIA
ncbi:hypothetical protein, partial [uncultured Chloroflexus sp.]|uniref:hypothetical protein n=1 Tax=uncultured Chloroflexus sp. TaxID=214040 RepID=UPI00263911AE